MRLSDNKRKGDYGETVAVGYLEGRNYGIIRRNYKRGSGEIDIIAKDNGTGHIVFVEVKYRKNASEAESPQFAVTKGKIGALKRTANWYITENQLDCDMRFDVIEVTGGEKLEINHIIDAIN